MDIAQLKTLMSVAELGSLNKAADKLHIAQPALSRQIRLMEEELQAQLFIRHGRGMVLTPIGHRVLRRARTIVAEMDLIYSDVSSFRHHLEGKVVLGMPPTIGEMITVPLTRLLQDIQPLMSFRYTAGFCGHLLDWLQRGDLDMAILYDPRPLKSVTRRPFVDEQLFAVGNADKKYRLDRPLRLEDLRGEPLVLPSSRHSLRALIDMSGVDLEVKFEVEALVTIKDVVMSGLGTTFLPMSYIKNDLAAGRLTAAPVVEPRLIRTLYIAFSTDRIASSEAQICERALLQLVERMIAGDEWPYAKLVTPPAGQASTSCSAEHIAKFYRAF